MKRVKRVIIELEDGEVNSYEPKDDTILLTTGYRGNILYPQERPAIKLDHISIMVVAPKHIDAERIEQKSKELIQDL